MSIAFDVETDLSSWMTPPVTAEPDRSTEESDTGNGLRLVRRFGHKIRYCHEWGCWLIFDGKRWHRDRTKEIESLAKLTVAAIYREAAEIKNKNEQSDRARWAITSASHSRTNAMIQMASSEPRVAVTPDRFDKCHWLLNCENGTLDLRAGELRPHDPGDLITKLAPASYDPSSRSPMWETFISKATKGDRELADFLQRASGYAVTGDVSEQCLFFLFGDGENGKTTFLETAGAVLGDYAVDVRSDLLIVKNNDEHPTAFTDLEGSRFVSTSETEDGKRLAESMVKSLTGGDTIKARKMRKDFYSFAPTFKFFIAANHKPIIRGTDHGIWRRINLIPFGHNFADDPDKVLDFKARVLSERDGILTWFVQGCTDWQGMGLAAPDVVKGASREYRREMDDVGNFLEQCCELDKENPSLRARAADLRNAYVDWCGRMGSTMLGPKKFGDELSKRGIDWKDSHGVRWRLGVGIGTADRGVTTTTGGPTGA